MKIRFLKTYSSTAGTWKVGDEREVPDAFGNKLIQSGMAEAVTAQRASRKRGGTKAEAAVDEDREER